MWQDRTDKWLGVQMKRTTSVPTYKHPGADGRSAPASPAAPTSTAPSCAGSRSPGGSSQSPKHQWAGERTLPLVAASGTVCDVHNDRCSKMSGAACDDPPGQDLRSDRVSAATGSGWWQRPQGRPRRQRGVRAPSARLTMRVGSRPRTASRNASVLGAQGFRLCSEYRTTSPSLTPRNPAT